MKLNQVIAIEKGVKNKAQTFIDTLYKAFDKPSLFEGFTKVYKKKNEEDEDAPPQRANVQISAMDALDEVTTEWAEMFNVVAQKDEGNLVATADVEDEAGKIVLKGVPATYLLFVEKQLTGLHSLIARTPTLDPAEVWKLDDSTKLYRTEPASTVRTKKVESPIVLYDATDKHPAQTQLITKDVNVGTWDHTRFSGALPEDVKKDYLRRVVALQVAVKKAREEANSVPVPPKPKYGESVFAYVFGD